MAVNYLDNLTMSASIPNKDKMIKAGGNDYVLRRRMPFNESDAPFMLVQRHQRIVQAFSRGTLVGYVPDLDSTVIRTRSYHVVIERAPLDV